MQQTTRRLADELDIAKEKIQALEKTELALSKAKQRLGEMGNLKAQVKELEEQNTEYMEKMLQQEATVNVTVPQLKSQVERHKNKVVDLDSALTGKSARIMAQEKDIEKLKEQIMELTKKKNSLHDQLDNAQLEIEQLKDEASDAGFGPSTGGVGGSAEDKETIARLERQVKALRMMTKKAEASGGVGGSTKSGSSEDINALRDELDDAVRSKNRIQEELVSSKNRIAELEQKLTEGNNSTGRPNGTKVPSPLPSTKMMID